MLRPELVKRIDEVLSAVNEQSSLIVDARPHSRWLGIESENRPGVASGRIPGSVNVPFRSLLEDDDMTRFKLVDELEAVFARAGVDLGSNTQIINTCGSGVSAAITSFAMHLCKRPLESVPVYDGSWAEWGSQTDTPKETGPSGKC